MTHAFDAFLENSALPGVFLRFPQPTQVGGNGLWFHTPIQELLCPALEHRDQFFKRLESALKKGYYAAGYLTYELGYGLAGVGCPHAARNLPLAWFGVFKSPQHVFWPLRTPHSFPGPDFWLRPARPLLTFSQYQKKIRSIHQRIAAGDTYQVNATFPLHTRFDGAVGSLFQALYQKQPAQYAAFMRGGGRTAISLSPELFFERCGDRIVTRPMKGTRSRQNDRVMDARQRQELRSSPKDQAENIMIVDLLRNDLGRLCQPGTVHVKDLFHIESLPTVHQMTSTVEGRLRLPVRWQTIFASLFPCGSVTGAPKIKTMEIIAQTEPEPRGIYTGALGWIGPDGEAQFNLPIRTLEWGTDPHAVRLSVGSGIVADSKADSEWQECLLKAAFVNERGVAQEYRLLETFLSDPGVGLRHESLHLERLRNSAAELGFVFSATRIRRALRQHVQRYLNTVRRLRLLLARDGGIVIESAPWTVVQGGTDLPIVRWARARTHSRNLFLRHKTTNRSGYDRLWHEAQARGVMDILFCNEQKKVTEGAITNVFIRRGNVLLTPPVKDGLLPGVERAFLMKGQRTVIEQSLYRRDVVSADEVLLANSVRGLFPVKLEV